MLNKEAVFYPTLDYYSLFVSLGPLVWVCRPTVYKNLYLITDGEMGEKFRMNRVAKLWSKE